MSATTSESLKKQFQHLQDQQQNKLARRKQLREEKEKSEQPPPAISSAFGINDDLDLKLCDPVEKKGSIYSEDLVDHLNDQIRELKDETGRLYKLLSERDLEVRQLRKKQKATSSSELTGAVTNDTAATKIVELSKKLREQTAELEGERTKGKQLTKKCLVLENQLQNAINSGAVNPKTGSGSRISALDDLNDKQTLEAELKSSQDKLRQSELKMAEFRNQCQSLRQDVKMANKVIGQEVGEGTTIQSLMNSGSNWRGRSQQIIALQKKVNDLRSQVDNQSVTSRSGPSLEEEFLGSATSKSSRNNIEDRHKDQIRRIDKERKEAQERMGADLQALTHDHDNLKQKMEASKARNKVLSTELKAQKQQVQTLLEKGKHDDELIGALLKQQTVLKASLEQTAQSRESTNQKQEQASRQLAQKTQQENNVIEQLRVIVAEKEGKVKALEDEIVAMRIQKAQMSGVQAMFDGQPSDRSVSSTVTDRSSRPPSVVHRPPNINTEDDLISASQPGSRLGTASSARSQRSTTRPGSVNRTQLDDLERQCQEHKSVSQATAVERNRLAEFVRVLQKRIDDSTQKATEAQAELVSQRRRNTQLEKQLAKSKLEPQGVSAKRQKSKTGSSANSLRESVSLEDETRTKYSIEELQISLEIQRDENAALKMALQRTLESKEEDLRLYSDMVEETKRVFLQGLRQYREHAS